VTTHELPPALRPWSESLSFLTVEAAVHIGPLVRRLDALVRRHDATTARLGEPDGFGGLTTKGHPERLLLSEWLLAEELPLEFMRRAAQNELLHINPVFRAAQPEGRVAVFCDVGPEQLGAARLVQLATLIVLHRRSRARGTDLMLGVSGAPATKWHGSELPELYTTWRRSREPAAPLREELEARQEAVDDKDELWVLAGDTLARAASAPLLLHTRETGWDAQGVTSVEVRFEGRATTLAVPPGRVSVQALRGAALRRHFVAKPGRETPGGALSAPLFPSHDRRLLLRGERPEDILVVSVPAEASGGARPKLYRFAGPVAAVTSLGGTRLVALVLHGDRLKGQVIGNKIGNAGTVDVALDDLGITVDALDLLNLPPLFFDRGDLLAEFAGEWWRLPVGGERPRLDDGTVTVGPAAQLDHPSRVRIDPSGRLKLNYDRTVAETVDAARLQAHAGDEWVAWTDGEDWRMSGRGFDPMRIDGTSLDTVLGAVFRADDRRHPALVGRSGDQWFLEEERDSTPLDACNGPALAHALHSRLGVMAIQRDPQSVQLIKLETGETLIEVHVG
jgi:hypothetical protein